MTRLAIVVEGPTEEEFVKISLTEHLFAVGVYPTPVVLGGDVKIERVAAAMSNAIWKYDQVTSLVDYYGFTDKGNATICELETLIDNRVDERIGRSWDQSRAFAYVQQYEFEGLLFSDVDAFQQQLIYATRDSVDALRRIRSRFPTPEHINDSPDTAPSKRINALIPRFRKRTDGPLLAAEIGLDKIRAECKRFDEWLMRLENLQIHVS